MMEKESFGYVIAVFAQADADVNRPLPERDLRRQSGKVIVCLRGEWFFIAVKGAERISGMKVPLQAGANPLWNSFSKVREKSGCFWMPERMPCGIYVPVFKRKNVRGISSIQRQAPRAAQNRQMGDWLMAAFSSEVLPVMAMADNLNSCRPTLPRAPHSGETPAGSGSSSSDATAPSNRSAGGKNTVPPPKTETALKMPMLRQKDAEDNGLNTFL